MSAPLECSVRKGAPAEKVTVFVMGQRDGVDEFIRHITVLRDAWAVMLNNPQGLPLTSVQPTMPMAAMSLG